MDDQQRARERFEQWCNGRYRLDKRINAIGDVVYADRWTQGAFVGFTAALRAAPEGFVLVPVEATVQMKRIGGFNDHTWRSVLAAARPQGDV